MWGGVGGPVDSIYAQVPRDSFQIDLTLVQNLTKLGQG